MQPAYYLIKVLVCSGLLVLYYSVALRNKQFHYYNRFYLLMSIVISIVLPLIDLHFFTVQSKSEGAIALLNVITVQDEKDTIVAAHNSFIKRETLISAGWIIITWVMLGILLWKIIKLYRLKNRYTITRMQEFDFIHTDLQQAPFSFLKNLFWRNDINISGETGQQILQHEIAHIKQKHSWDKIFMQVILSVFWMNPFYWFIQKELFLIHEFIADEKALKDKDASAFAAMLLQVQFGDSIFSPAQSINYSPIKRRLFMLSTSKEPRYSYARRLLALPLLAVIVCLFAFKLHRQEDSNHTRIFSNTSFTLVVDAGHGGNDVGAAGLNNTYEKDIALALAKKVKALSNEYGVNVVLTRETDVYMSPKEKSDFSNAQHANALISLHVDAAEKLQMQQSRFKVVIPKSNTHEFSNTLLGSSILQSLQSSFKVSDALTQKSQKIWILDNSTIPAVLIECGYINDKTNAENLSDASKQELLARRILEGVALFSNNKVTATNYTAEVLQSAADTAKPEPKPLVVINGKIEPDIKIDDIKPEVITTVNVLKEKDATDKYGTKAKDGAVEITTNTDKYLLVKAAPLYYADGKESTAEKVKQIKPENIAVDVLTDKKATDKYGAKGKNGVVEITTKSRNKSAEAVKFTPPVIVADSNFTPPHFPGGAEEWQKYLQRQLNGDVPLKNKAPTGKYTVTVSFNVDAFGNLSAVKAENDPGYGTAQEAVRVIQRGPKWIPAKIDDKNIETNTKQTITFSVEEG